MTPPAFDLERFAEDYRTYVDRVTAARPHTLAMVGRVIRKPYRPQDLVTLNELLDQVDRDGLSLNIRETESRLFVIAYRPYTPLRRDMRQVS